MSGTVMSMHRFVTMSEFYPFVLFMACGGMIFIKSFKFLKKKISFFLFHLIFLMLLLLYKPHKAVGTFRASP